MADPTSELDEANWSIPSVVRSYFTALDDGDGGRAAAAFSVDATMELPSPEHDTAPRTVVRGREIEQLLTGRPPPTWRHELVFGARSDASLFVEGEVRDLSSDEPLATFLTVLTVVRVGEDERIDRYVAYRRAGATRRITRTSAPGTQAIAVLQEICARTTHDRRVDVQLTDTDSVWLPAHASHSTTAAGSVALLREMHVADLGASGSTAVATGVARHPDHDPLMVDFALSVTVAGNGDVDRLVLYWAEPQRTKVT